MLNINELKKLEKLLIKNEEDFLKNIVLELLNSKIKNETISPLILTHKEFIDTSLKKIIKKIKQKLIKIAKEKNLPTYDKIFDVKLDYLAAYMFKKDLSTKKIIHTTIAKHLINLIKKDHTLLNNFASTLSKIKFKEKHSIYQYPELYPYDKHKYATPIPLLRQELTKIENIKKNLNILNQKYSNKQNLLNQKIQLKKDIINAIKCIKNNIIPTLKNKKNFQDKKFIFTMQHKRFELMYENLKKEIELLTKEINYLIKNIEGFKEKNKKILNKEEIIIKTIAENLSKTKKKVN